MLEINQLSVRYHAITAVDGVNLALSTGELAVIDGHHGAGKSSLLKAIIGAVASIGEVSYRGRILRRRTPASMLREGIVLVPEGRNLFATMTTRENLEFGASVAGRKADLDRALYLFPELADSLSVPACSLSGGQAQMLSFARGLMSEPEFMLLDEPLLGLAQSPADCVWRTICTLRDQGVGVLMTGQHNVPDPTMTNQFIELKNGQILKENSNVS